MGGQMNIIFSSTKKQNLKPDKLPKPAQLGKLQILKLVKLRSQTQKTRKTAKTGGTTGFPRNHSTRGYLFER